MTEILYFKNKIKMKSRVKDIKNIINNCLDIEGESFILALSGEILSNISFISDKIHLLFLLIYFTI